MLKRAHILRLAALDKSDADIMAGLGFSSLNVSDTSKEALLNRLEAAQNWFISAASAPLTAIV